MQGITVYSLPEKEVIDANNPDFSGLYIASSYGGRDLQVDDYTLKYDKKLGLQTVVVEADGKTASFDIILAEAGDEIADFGEYTPPVGTVAYAAVYDKDGRFLCLEEAIRKDGHAKMRVPAKYAAEAEKACLYTVTTENYAPAGAAINKEI